MESVPTMRVCRELLSHHMLGWWKSMKFSLSTRGLATRIMLSSDMPFEQWYAPETSKCFYID